MVHMQSSMSTDARGGGQGGEAEADGHPQHQDSPPPITILALFDTRSNTNAAVDTMVRFSWPPYTATWLTRP